MEWRADKGRSSTDSGATRAPLPPGLAPASAAARGQSAELIDADITAGFARGVAPMQTVSPAQRAEDEAQVAAEINAALARAGVPAVKIVFAPRRKGGRGVFTARQWQLTLNTNMFHDPQHRLELLGTAYHEARHAEQYFDALRMAARLYPDKSAARMARWIRSKGEHAPPLAVIEAARQRPGQPGEGETWFEFYFGDKAETHRETRAWSKYMIKRFNQMKADGRRLRALREEMRADGQEMSLERVKAYNRDLKRASREAAVAHAAYLDLADEKDARAAQDGAIKAIEAAR